MTDSPRTRTVKIDMAITEREGRYSVSDELATQVILVPLPDSVPAHLPDIIGTAVGRALAALIENVEQFHPPIVERSDTGRVTVSTVYAGTSGNARGGGGGAGPTAEGPDRTHD